MSNIKLNLSIALTIGTCVISLILIFRAVDRPPALTEKISCLRIFSSAEDLNYRLGGSAVFEFENWLWKSKTADLATGNVVYEVALEFYGGGDETIQFLALQENNDSIYFKWSGRWRKGNRALLQGIFDEPKLVPCDEYQTATGVFYRSKFGCGSIDTKTQRLNTSHDIVWRDTNEDGFFDQEYIFDNNSNLKYQLKLIKIAVPRNNTEVPVESKNSAEVSERKIRGHAQNENRRHAP